LRPIGMEGSDARGAHRNDWDRKVGNAAGPALRPIGMEGSDARGAHRNDWG
jgi:hypothetical protein